MQFIDDVNRLLLAPLFVVLTSCGSTAPDKTATKSINENTYKEEWPYKEYTSGTLTCIGGIKGSLPGSPEKLYNYVLFTPDTDPKRVYAVNGTALGNADKEGFYSDRTIRKRDLYTGLASTAHLIEDGLKLCEKEK